MSERVLTDKIKMRPYGEGGIAFSDDGCKCGEGGLVVMDFDGDPFAVEQHASGCDDEEIAARVILALAARVAELELDREGRIRSSDYDKALIEELEAENAKLRRCVEAADDFVETVVIIETSQAMHRVYSVALAHGAPYNGMDWSKQLSTYRSARAEVDK